MAKRRSKREWTPKRIALAVLIIAAALALRYLEVQLYDAEPPVAITEGVLPSSASMRSMIPSIIPALPYMIPLRMQSMVFFPITFLGISRLIEGNCAALLLKESKDTRSPGKITPPI